MQRVKKVVDYCIDEGLYVILSMQNDYNHGYFLLKSEYKNSLEFIYNIWRQITIAFNEGYDQHLIFESFSQIDFENCSENNNYCEQEYLMLNEYNELVLKVVRLSKKNNKRRFILFTPLNSNNDLLNKFVMPEDEKIFFKRTSRTLLSINFYTPYNFTVNEDENYNKFEDEYKSDIVDNLYDLYSNFYKRGYNVILNKVGSIDKNNIEDRISYAKYLVENARKYHMCSVLSIIGEKRDPVRFESDDLVNAYIRTAQRPFRQN